MDWLNDVLKALIEDETKRNETVESIKKELGTRFIPKDKFNEVNAELKAQKEQAVASETLVKELTEKAKTAEEKDAIIKKLQDDSTAFQADTEKRIARTQKESALQLQLASEVDKSAVDLVAGLFDLDKLELKDGKLSNYDDLAKPIREQRQSLFVTQKTETPPNTGGRSPEGTNKMTDEEYYAAQKITKFV